MRNVYAYSSITNIKVTKQTNTKKNQNTFIFSVF